MSPLRFLLDTNICIYIINRQPEAVFKHFAKLQAGEVGISSITGSELHFGVAKSGSVRILHALEKFIAPLDVLPFDDAAMREYGKARAHLEKKGTPIGSLDVLIASHALALDVVLVTNNLREFKRVPGLRVANWV